MVFLLTATGQAMMTSQAILRIKILILRSDGTPMSQKLWITHKNSMRSSLWISCCATTQGWKKITCFQTISTSKEVQHRIMLQDMHSIIFQFSMLWCSMITLLRSQKEKIGVQRETALMNIMTVLQTSSRAWTNAWLIPTLITKSTTAQWDPAWSNLIHYLTELSHQNCVRMTVDVQAIPSTGHWTSALHTPTRL